VERETSANLAISSRVFAMILLWEGSQN
jgi:hypothetical protein